MISIIDYGMGNLRSVFNALETVGAEVLIAKDPLELRKADKIVLPGVGSFGVAMTNLQKTGWVEEMQVQVLEKKKPLLGICLGMQILADLGTEGAVQRGLGFVSGRVERLSESGLTIPHIGWNDVSLTGSHPLFFGIESKAIFYFLHSFKFVPQTESVTVATCHYGETFTAAITSENIFGTQFHPEKSQSQGLRLLENFVNLEGTR